MNHVQLGFAPLLLALLAACGGGSSAPTAVEGPPTVTGCARTWVGLTPLSDLAGGTYKGEPGGLYPGGNGRPAFHDAAGLAYAQAVQPRDAAGAPSAQGRYALISLGMSNTTQEFQVFKALADADPAREPRLAIVDGAQGGQTAAIWSNPSSACWGVLDARLAGAGISPAQVAVVWIKQADASPTSGWPAYARTLQQELAAILKLLAQRFPNLRLAYLSSRIYAGYATTALNPEPYAYESAFSVKWLIQDQLQGVAGMNHAGPNAIPWIAWGPYLWADGVHPRSDGLSWACTDLSSSDGTHPSSAGQQKVANLLLEFCRTDSTARAWYLKR